MNLLPEQQAEPELPAYDSLPGTPLPGIEDYVQRMQVFPAPDCLCPKHAVGQTVYCIAVGNTMPCQHVVLCCLETCFLSML